MTTWYKLTIPTNDFLAETGRIGDQFPLLWAAAGETFDYAVFGTKYVSTSLYFTPAASELALLLGATPCAAPSRDDLVLFAGDPSAKELIFSR